jgi:hypothetical protein
MLKRQTPGLVGPVALGAPSAHWDSATGDSTPRVWVSGGLVHINGDLVATGAGDNSVFPAGSVPASFCPRASRAGYGTFFDAVEESEAVVSVSVGADGSILINAVPDTDDTLIFSVTYPLGF